VRSILLIAVSLFALGSGGCAGFIAEQGYRLGAYKTLDEVQAGFGNPDFVEQTEEGQKVYYTTRKKIAAPDRAYGFYLGAATSLGLSEIIAVPCELVIFASETIGGKKIYFMLDNNGNVIDSGPKVWYGDVPHSGKALEEDKPKPEEPEEPKEK